MLSIIICSHILSICSHILSICSHILSICSHMLSIIICSHILSICSHMLFIFNLRVNHITCYSHVFTSYSRVINLLPALRQKLFLQTESINICSKCLTSLFYYLPEGNSGLIWSEGNFNITYFDRIKILHNARSKSAVGEIIYNCMEFV